MKTLLTNKDWKSMLLAGGILAACLAMLLLLPAATSQANPPQLGIAPLASLPKPLANTPQYPKIVDNDSVVFGRTLGQWDAAWQQWANSIRVSEHPLFDNADCSKGQTGPVWFLGGKFCANNATCSFTGVNRNCSIPYGKLVYFPVFNGEDSLIEETLAENPGNELAWQITNLRAVTDGTPPDTIYCYIDGAAVPNLVSAHRVKSDAFGFTMPDDNLLKAIYGNPSFVAGTYFPAVDDGYYLMLGQLSRGHHTLHFGGGWNGGFQLDITYHLNIH